MNLLPLPRLAQLAFPLCFFWVPPCGIPVFTRTGFVPLKRDSRGGLGGEVFFSFVGFLSGVRSFDLTRVERPACAVSRLRSRDLTLYIF